MTRHLYAAKNLGKSKQQSDVTRRAERGAQEDPSEEGTLEGLGLFEAGGQQVQKTPRGKGAG